MVNIFDCSTVTTILFLGYFAFIGQKFYQMMNPLDGIEITGPTIDPLWPENQQYDIVCYLSGKEKFKLSKPQTDINEFRQAGRIIFERKGLIFNSTQEHQMIDLSLSNNNTVLDKYKTPNNEKNENMKLVDSWLWSNIHQNKSNVFLHVLIFRNDGVTDEDYSITTEKFRNGEILHGSVKLIKFDKIPKTFRQRYLLSDFGLVQLNPLEKKRLSLPSDSIISYWKPEVAVKMVTDFSQYPEDYVPQSIQKRLLYKGNKLHFSPAFHVDEIGLTSDKYIALNESVNELPLKISIGPMSQQRWLLMTNLDEAISSQKEQGFSEKDTDDVRRLISDTSVYLLAVTMIASLLHLLFEALAFKSDISFWQNNQSLAGLSTRAVITELFSQIVVFLFLIESDTSLLVIIPSFFGILIQMWKVHKATGFQIKFVPISKGLISFKFTRWEKENIKKTDLISNENDKTEGIKEIKKSGKESKNDKNTDESQEIVTKATTNEEKGESPDDALVRVTLEADRFATVYLSAILFPLIIIFILHSLIYEKHLSWYSWAIGALTGCVYAFGFILMCPQLYINHQLKSVSHLPWKFLVYKFLNTFIDDLFAFIIKMPTMHRLSVFRDDLVFIIYLYQRWIYRVDSSRPIEK